MKAKIYLLLLWKICLVGLPIVLLLLPADFFDSGETVCLSHTLFDLECPGCGMTRAMMHLIHFNLETAIDFNVFVLIVAPLLFLIWVKQILKYFFQKNILKFL